MNHACLPTKAGIILIIRLTKNQKSQHSITLDFKRAKEKGSPQWGMSKPFDHCYKQKTPKGATVH